jgi:hypothetical protein
MTKVSRSDIYVRDEKGPAWLEDFFKSLAGQKDAGIQDILDAFNSKKNQTVEGVVQNYREQVGLDILGSSEDGDENIKEASIKNASEIGPISPMKLKKLESPDDMLKDYDEKDIIVQLKFDGFKTQAIKTKDGVKLYTRRGEEFTENVPALVKNLNAKMKSGSFILGELVWEDSKGKQSISDIQTVVGSSPEKAHAKIEEGGGKVIFYVYDLLWDSGNDITKQKYIDRYNKLKGIVGKAADVKVAENYSYSEKDKAIEDALKNGGEGIVLKPKDSEYKYGNKGSNEQHGEWAKFKPGAKAHADEVLLNKYEKGKDKLIFPMYQHKDGELFEVGKLSGMSEEDEAKIKKDIDGGKEVVVEITYQERMPSGKFRHVGWSRFRPDKPAKEVKVSKSSFRPLSIRHAERKSIKDIIEKHPTLKRDIENLCQGSGGTKSTYSIIAFVRDQLKDEHVSFTDEELNEYINAIKGNYKQQETDKYVDVGKIGTTPEQNYEDNVADYVTHGAK